ncbi:MAG: YceI family protein [Gammaproteobacteria bacterium]|nr:MAG: YceI family protein [Gammaproteobacteria bacterium]
MKRYALTLLFLLASSLAVTPALAYEHYVIDTKDAHAFITFRIQHLGFSWMEGRFKRFSGRFDYAEANPALNKVEVEIDVASIDTDHAVRDKHLRSERYLDVKRYPKAHFVSTAWTDHGDGTATLTGTFTLRGVSKQIELTVRKMGHGKDPWGGYRRGFEATTTLRLSDYAMRDAPKLGPHSEEIRIWISLEGVRQDSLLD